jgi:hypothetical protein
VPDEFGNRSEGSCFAVEAGGNTVLNAAKPVALLGVDDLMIVETPEALLVLPKQRAQEVKKVVEKIKEKGRKELL